MAEAGANLNLGLGDLNWSGAGAAPAAPQQAPTGLNLGLGSLAWNGPGEAPQTGAYNGYNPFAGPVGGAAPNPFDPSLSDEQKRLMPGVLMSPEQIQAAADARVKSIAPDSQGLQIQRPNIPGGGTGAGREATLADQQMQNINLQRSGISRDLDLAHQAGDQAVARADAGKDFANEAVGLGQGEAQAKAQAQRDAQVRIAAAQKAYIATKDSALADSGKLWSKDSTGVQKFMILAGMALAGYTDVKNAERGERSNNAATLMTALMEQNRSAAKQKVEAAAGALKMTQDERDQALVQIDTDYAAKWEDLKRRQQARLAEIAPGEARTKAEQGYRDIEKAALKADSEALETAQKFALGQAQREAVTGRANARAAARAGRGGGGGPADPNDPYKGMNANQRDIAMRKDAALQVSALDGSEARKAKDPTSARKLNEARAAANGMRDQIQEMRQFIKDEGTMQVPFAEADAIKRRQAITTAMAGHLTVLNKTGVLNDKEYLRYSDMTTPNWYQSNKGADAAFDQLDRTVAGGYHREFEAHTQVAPTNYQGVGSPQAPASRAAPGRSLEPGQVSPVTPTSVPQTAAPAAGQIPPGAVMGTYKGKRGYKLGDQFYPL
jgi:hypothetical protein